MQNIVETDYINQRDKELTELFISSTNRKKYILGINKLTKSVQKYVEVDGIIDDFTRIHTSRKKSILKIDDVDKNSIILSTATGSPLEVGIKLDEMGFTHFNYLSFYKYSSFDLAQPPFITDFKDDYKNNQDKYNEIFDLLEDDKSRKIFEKVINFKISFNFDFMQGFTNNHEAQYFDKEIIPEIKDIRFVDGGAYIGDTLKEVIKNFPDYKKIYCIEPSDLHINIAKKNFAEEKNIEFINCGLGNKKQLTQTNKEDVQINCDHNYQTNNIDTLDNIINEEVDYIKLDIEGAEQDTIDGAKETIKKYKPILAICIYHKAEDWYRIPQKVLEINPEYKVYLRHYMEGIYETVMYFIPQQKSSFL